MEAGLKKLIERIKKSEKEQEGLYAKVYTMLLPFVELGVLYSSHRTGLELTYYSREYGTEKYVLTAYDFRHYFINSIGEITSSSNADPTKFVDILRKKVFDIVTTRECNSAVMNRQLALIINNLEKIVE